MINDNFPYESNSQLSISYELLCLLKWLVENDNGTLQMIIEDAIEQGALAHEHSKKSYVPCDDEHASSIQESVIDFFYVLEDYLQQASREHAQRTVKAKALMPTLDHVDSTLYDTKALQSSVEHVAHNLDKNPGKNPKQLLYETLLAQWQPHEKVILN